LEICKTRIILDKDATHYFLLNVAQGNREVVKQLLHEYNINNKIVAIAYPNTLERITTFATQRCPVFRTIHFEDVTDFWENWTLDISLSLHLNWFFCYVWNKDE